MLSILFDPVGKMCDPVGKMFDLVDKMFDPVGKMFYPVDKMSLLLGMESSLFYNKSVQGYMLTFVMCRSMCFLSDKMMEEE